MNKRRANGALVAGLLAMALGPAWADKPEWAGQGKDRHKAGKDKDRRGGHGGHGDRREPRMGRYFDDRDRRVAHGWYDDHYGGGRKGCPPGLAKKNNGCMPPGQARKYAVGRPLPAGVVMYPVPAAIVVQLPPPPHGHKYVRVATDILLIAVGTSMVVDAITDLGRL